MRPKTARQLSLWAPVALVAGGIYIASAVPNETGRKGRWGSDKLAHLAEFAPLGFLLTRAACGTWGRSRGMAGGAAVCSAVVAAVDEYHQGFVPGRRCDHKDTLADTVGALLGVLLYWKGARAFRELIRRKLSRA